MVLGLSAIFNAEETDANCQNKKRVPNGRLLVILSVQMRMSRHHSQSLDPSRSDSLASLIRLN
jgi:hypothetical protein